MTSERELSIRLPYALRFLLQGTFVFPSRHIILNGHMQLQLRADRQTYGVGKRRIVKRMWVVHSATNMIRLACEVDIRHSYKGVLM